MKETAQSTYVSGLSACDCICVTVFVWLCVCVCDFWGLVPLVKYGKYAVRPCMGTEWADILETLDALTGPQWDNSQKEGGMGKGVRFFRHDFNVKLGLLTTRDTN